MKAIMVMFDSLNRHFLPPYGCDWTHAPNFQRLAQKTTTFDRSYVCSMPCMPARRDLHTGRPNFLHRCWGPLEPFDDSMPQLLKNAGVHTHLATDHGHYFEDGGATYHGRYTTWEYFRGQEGDPCIGQIANPTIPPMVLKKQRNEAFFRQDWINRSHMAREECQPQHKTFVAGLDFIERNHDEDNWLLQIETFDPHEPFFTQRQYKDLYAEHYEKYQGEHFDWPPYTKVNQSPEEIEHVRYEYAALLSMCDARLGHVLDAMDQHNLWEDTMLIVWTDHGFLLGEHDCWAKCHIPFYEHVAHTPFFVWDPRNPQANQRRNALTQPAIDLPVTLLEYFNQPIPPDMLGQSLAPAIANDTPLRDAAIFGIHGGHINVTDGRYVYMRGPVNDDNQPLSNHTLMPTRMRGYFDLEKFGPDLELAPPFSFTKSCHTLKTSVHGGNGLATEKFPTLLFDLQTDPHQESPLEDQSIEQQMVTHLIKQMQACDAPTEQYQRVGLPQPSTD